jgi:hypothetical protein
MIKLKKITNNEFELLRLLNYGKIFEVHKYYDNDCTYCGFSLNILHGLIDKKYVEFVRTNYPGYHFRKINYNSKEIANIIKYKIWYWKTKTFLTIKGTTQ